MKEIVAEIDRNLNVHLSSDSEPIKALVLAWRAGHEQEAPPNEVRWELLALDVRLVDRQQRQESRYARFRPMWEMRNDETDPPTVEVYPDVEELLADNQAISYYSKRLEETPNPIRKARYADLIWVALKRQSDPKSFQYGVKAVGAYLAEASLRAEQGSHIEHAYLYLVRSLDQAAEIAVQLNNLDLASEVRSKIKDFLVQMPEPDRYRWVLDMGETLQLIEKKFPDLVSKDIWTFVRETAVQGITYHDARKRRNLSILHALMQLARQVLTRLGEREAAWRYRVQIAESLEKEGTLRAKEEGGSGGKLVGYSFMEQAMRDYQQLISVAPNDGERQRLRQRFEETKRKVRQLIRLAESEMKSTSVSITVSHDDLEKMIKPLLEADTNNVLQVLCSHPALLPHLDDLRQQARENAKKYPLWNSFTKNILRDGRKVAEIPSGVEETTPYFDLDLWFQLHYKFLDFVFSRLKEARRFTKEMYLSHLQKWEFLDEEDILFIEVGLDRYFAEDFVSALHVLTPRIEHMLKSAFEQAGLPSVTVPDKKKIREGTLGNFLEQPDVKKALGEDLWHYLNFALSDERGFNLRNDIAHGWMRFVNCNRIPVQIVLFIILQLTQLQRVSDPVQGTPTERETKQE